jgi:hypothetical protein
MGMRRKMPQARGLRLTFTAAAIMSAGTCECFAQTINWNNFSGGTFNVPGNWSGGAVPGTSNSANFPSLGNYTVTFTSSPTNINASHSTVGEVT